MKNIMLIGLILTIPNILLSAEKEYKPLVDISTGTMVRANLAPASVIGNKGINTKVRESLSQENQKIIYDIEHPGCIKALYGFNSQVISKEHKDALSGMPKEIKKGLAVRVKKVEGSYYINPKGTNRDTDKSKCCDVYSHRACIPTAGVSIPSGVAYLITMLCQPASIAQWAACAGPIIVVPPLCAAVSAEVGNCAYHRCCAEEEIWYSNDKSQSDSESEEQSD